MNGSKSRWQKSDLESPKSFFWVRYCSLANYLNNGIEFTFTGFVMTLKQQDRQMWYKEEYSREVVIGWIVEPTRVVWSIAKKHKPCTPETEQSQAVGQAGFCLNGFYHLKTII